MTAIPDFELLAERDIAELNTRARLYRHRKTGAQVLSLENDDENKVFGITFATPPTDSTGVPHIMEHAVLCGSRKYPVKEPFVELMKGSLQTFLNAMTYSDKTCYPVASQNVQDFYNLIDVYLDAVFYPNITPQTLQQEGWHYELDDPDAPLTFKGVVFNEMKGAYSDPDNYLNRQVEHSLFPDNAYGVDSGGDPAVIPDLTYEQFKRFHETYYHPSNALIFFYGDDDPAERLRIIQSYLDDFDPIQVDAAIPLQAPFDAPRRLTFGYDAGEEGADGKKTMVTVNWALDEVTDVEATLALSILDYILIGTPASPLRKALIDSGLGEDLAGVGLELDTRQSYFSTGLKGVSLADADKVESLILSTLSSLAQDGIEPEMIEAAVNTVEFQLRENNTGPYPRGLLLMLRALRPWLHGGDPLAALAFEAPLAAIKQKLADDPAFFEGLITRRFLQNPHRTTVILRPDPETKQRREAAERERLAAARAAMSDDALRRVIEETRQLKRAQETPDSPEALATIPALKLEDLDRENKIIPLDVSDSHGCQVLFHDLFTNGIVYLDLGFNLRTLPQEALPYVPLFGRALLEMGTETEDYVKLAQRIGRKTGGIQATSFASAVHNSDQAAAWSVLRGKATVEQAGELFDIVRDVLLTARLDDQARFRQLVLEEKASLESSLLYQGHLVVRSRLQSRLNEGDWVGEQFGGVSYLLFLRRLAERVDNDWPAVRDTLEDIRRRLINRQAMAANVTLDETNWLQVRPRLDALLAGLPGTEPQLHTWTWNSDAANEGLTIPAQVNYVGKGADLYTLGYYRHGSIIPIINYLRTTWLWERVRVHGGAYGGFCAFDWRSGAFAFLSYRDPNLLETIDVYDQTGAFLRQLELGRDELVKSVIGAIAMLDAYQLPDAKGYTSFQRYLVGETDAMRQQLRDEVLATTPEHFKQFADVLDRLSAKGLVVVMGSQDAIEAANAARQNAWLKITKVL